MWIKSVQLENFQSHKSTTLSLHPHYNTIVGSGNNGKCVVGDTLIFTEKGILPIASFDQNQEPEEVRPLSLKLHSKDGIVSTSLFYKSSLQKTYKVRTNYGYELEGTHEHPIYIFTPEGRFRFRKLSELKVGDYVCIQRGQNYWSKKEVDLTGFKFEDRTTNHVHKVYTLPKVVTKEFARFLGYLVAEGNMTSGNAILFSNEDSLVTKEYRNLTKLLFGYRVREGYDLPRKVTQTICSVQVKQFLNYCGVLNVLSAQKEIPWVILQSPKEIVVEYLKAYFEGDGSATGGHVEVATASEKMSKQLQILLSNFGIISHRREYKACATNGTRIKRTYYRLVIAGGDLDIFAREIGFLSQRKNNRLVSYKSNSRRPHNDIIPGLRQYLLRIYRRYYVAHHSRHSEAHEGIKALGRRRWSLLKEYAFNSRNNVTYKQAALFRHYIPPDLLKHEFFFDPVAQLYQGRATTYDFTIPEYHNFTSNSIISHNSSLVRALSLVLSNVWDTSWVRHGASFCRITVITSDNVIIIREKGLKINKYIVRVPEKPEQVYENFGNQVPAEVMQYLQTPKVTIDTNDQLSLNIANQLDPLFLLSRPGSTKAKILGKLSGAHYLDHVLKEVNKDKKNIQAEKNLKATEVLDIQTQLIKYNDLERKQQKLFELEQRFKGIDQASIKQEQLKQLLAETQKWKARFLQASCLFERFQQYPIPDVEKSQQLIQRLQNLRSVQDLTKTMQIQQEQLTKSLSEAQILLLARKKIYVDLLKQQGACPLCSSQVTEETLKVIERELTDA